MGPDNYERQAALNALANDFIGRARQCAGDGSSVGAREWLQAAIVAMEGAHLAYAPRPLYSDRAAAAAHGRAAAEAR